MVTVRDLIKVKGNSIWSVSPETTVVKTLELMSDKDVGALVVLQDGKVVGIISERDFVRSIAKTGKCLLDAPVQNYMTREVFAVDVNQNIEVCMQLMTDKHIRHLPVVEKGELMGVISIGDVVKELISSRELTINQLENYILGSGYGH